MTRRATQRWGRRAGAGALAIAGGVVMGVAPSSGLSAHTEASAVAVAAGSEAVVSFQPAHGCGESPTVAVRVQAPVPDARAAAVEGWTATATPDGAGNTVLEWTGGSLPADEEGSFPVELVVPDAVGSLLAFPAVQRCASGEELAWVGTAPGDEFPAPQVLVLAAGSEPATTLDDVPADAPGRDLLVALAASASDDDDAAAAPATAVTSAPGTATPVSTAAASTTATSVASATTTGAASTAPAPTTSSPSSAPSTAATASTVPTTTEGGDGGGGSTGWVVAAIAAVVVIGGALALYARRRG